MDEKFFFLFSIFFLSFLQLKTVKTIFLFLSGYAVAGSLVVDVYGRRSYRKEWENTERKYK
jgi:hypothetical protein